MKTNPVIPKDPVKARQAEDKVIQLQNKVIEQGCNLTPALASTAAIKYPPRTFADKHNSLRLLQVLPDLIQSFTPLPFSTV